MTVVVFINPSALVISMLVANIATFALFRRLAVTRRPKSWGIVYDQATKKPLRNVVVRIFETRFNKLLETQISDAKGRYGFLVGSSEFTITYEKPGYRGERRGPVNPVASRKRDQSYTVDVKLEPGSSSSMGLPKPGGVVGTGGGGMATSGGIPT